MVPGPNPVAVSIHKAKPSRVIAILETLLVSAIWASSFVLIKLALKDFSPLTLAGVRYFGAFLLLLPWIALKREENLPKSRTVWRHLAFLGLSAYTIGNAALFWGLKYLPATTSSFAMNFVPVFILFGGAIWLGEIPTRWQVLGLILSLAGSLLFFWQGLAPGEPLGLLVTFIGLASFAAFGVLGRSAARNAHASTLSLTAIPLAIGGGALLVIAPLIEGLPHPGMSSIGVVVWLAAINTAFAYLLYYHALRTLTALEMNMMMNLTPLGTALLAWIMLGDRLTLAQVIGMLVVIAGVALVQWGRSQKKYSD